MTSLSTDMGTVDTTPNNSSDNVFIPELIPRSRISTIITKYQTDPNDSRDSTDSYDIVSTKSLPHPTTHELIVEQYKKRNPNNSSILTKHQRNDTIRKTFIDNNTFNPFVTPDSLNPNSMYLDIKQYIPNNNSSASIEERSDEISEMVDLSFYSRDIVRNQDKFVKVQTGYDIYGRKFNTVYDDDTSKPPPREHDKILSQLQSVKRRHVYIRDNRFLNPDKRNNHHYTKGKKYRKYAYTKYLKPTGDTIRDNDTNVNDTNVNDTKDDNYVSDEEEFSFDNDQDVYDYCQKNHYDSKCICYISEKKNEKFNESACSEECYSSKLLDRIRDVTCGGNCITSVHNTHMNGGVINANNHCFNHSMIPRTYVKYGENMTIFPYFSFTIISPLTIALLVAFLCIIHYVSHVHTVVK